MSKPNLREPSEDLPAASEARRSDLPSADGRPADAEMARVLGTTPFHMALDSSGAGIAHWKHEPLHDVVEPMTHHVIMAYNGHDAAHGAADRKSGCDWNVSSRGCDHHSGRIKLPMGYSETC